MKRFYIKPPQWRRGRPRKITFTADQAERLRQALIRHGVDRTGRPCSGVFEACAELKAEFPEGTFDLVDAGRHSLTVMDAVQSVIHTLP